MDWLGWAIDDPAPPNTCGYGSLNVPCEVAPELRYGMLWHSAEGEFWGPPSELMRTRGVSWDATIGRSSVFRHRPRPTFVSWHGGGPAQNIPLVGVEVAGANGEAWTATQRGLILRVALDTWRYFGWRAVVLGFQTDRTQEAIREAILGRGRGSLFEHIWVNNTSCPGGRDDYTWLMAELEAIMAGFNDEQKRDIQAACLKAVQKANVRRLCREAITQQLPAIAAAVAAAIPRDGGGMSPAQVEEILRQVKWVME